MSNRERLLKIMEILREETDEDHKLTLAELKERLQRDVGPHCHAGDRAIREDLAALDENGFPVYQETGPRGIHRYSHIERSFEHHEIRMLVDAVLTAKFIPRSDAEKLVEKLLSQTSRHMRAQLRKHVHFDGYVRLDHRTIRYEIEKLQKAVIRQQKVLFQYGSYNVNKEFVLRRNGEFYEVEPVELVFNQGFYYLIGTYVPENMIRHYRVDRIRNLTVTDQRFRKNEFNLAEYLGKVFHMFTGTRETVTIHFRNHLVNVVIDQFGLDVDLKKVDDEWFELKAKVLVSDGLVAWLLGWGGDAKVIRPESLVNKVREKIGKMGKLYVPSQQ
ncbi:helix-turn-helix transcriptional regulator [Staphylospora marina]|uniref:helix-turn-helix transcriptional regulator n=1 Tax=Staphylospora marina TaxID=2490858 RepID=UPI000F5BD40A|nr:WYL domain-containing protein [Staphylospora marina]